MESTIGAVDNFSAGIVYGLYKRMNKGLSYFSFGLKDWTEILNSGLLFSTEVCGSTENYLPRESVNQRNLRININQINQFDSII